MDEYTRESSIPGKREKELAEVWARLRELQQETRNDDEGTQS